MEIIFFAIFGLMAIASAVAVIALRNPVHSAICLIVCLLQIAALYVLLRSPFLAAVQVFIYVGAVMVLFLFAVMMLDIGKERLKRHIHGQRKIALPAVLVFLAAAAFLVLRGELSAPLGPYTEAALADSTEVLGKLLYTSTSFRSRSYPYCCWRR